MKRHSIILILFLCSLNLFAQEKEFKYDYTQGYNFIKKAEQSLKKGKLEKAEEYLANAKASNYGFCGNAWASAYSSINMVEVQVLNARKKYDKALALLDSTNGCSFGADCSKRDSLKVETLFLKFGKEKVKAAFRKFNAVNNSGDADFEPDYWAYIEDLNYTFHFEIYRIYLNGKRVEIVGNNFYDVVKDRTFYKLIE
jgi:hypothetical protein